MMGSQAISIRNIISGQPLIHTLRWLDGPAAFSAVEDNSPLLAADSFLVASGRVRGWERHWERFAHAGRRHGIEPRRLEAFRCAVAQLLPTAGRWFPRVELVAMPEATGELRVRIRPAPALMREAVAWTMPVPDPRRTPQVKGPDLALLGTWRSRARELGADEAMVVDDDGCLLEGAYSSLLWWEDDVLCALPDEAPILPGVTRALLLGLARVRGTPVRFRRPFPDELAGRETWLVSALHGICRVRDWAGVDRPAGAATRAVEWRWLLDSTAATVPRTSAGIGAT